MVGVDSTRKCSKAEMDWLKNGGRDKIEKAAKQFNQKGNVPGDFYVSIMLPSDIMVSIRSIGAVAYQVYCFGFCQKMAARKLWNKLRNHPEVEEATIQTGKQLHEIADNEYYIDVSWHGDEAYWRGWQFVETVLPKNLFKKGV